MLPAIQYIISHSIFQWLAYLTVCDEEQPIRSVWERREHWLYSMHHATTDLKFGSCTVLSSSPPVIEASKYVHVEIESRS